MRAVLPPRVTATMALACPRSASVTAASHRARPCSACIRRPVEVTASGGNCSASRMIASSVCTDSTGKAPDAVSPASMMASTPSSTALAASLTSARVGRGSLRMDSSTCVATMTGRPMARARRVISFCRRGTRSSGTSRPRSPRATITASASARIGSRCSIACGRSSLATIGVDDLPTSSITARAARTSETCCTNDSPIMSTPAASPNRRSSSSFAVSPSDGSATPGAVMPLCSANCVPCTTVVWTATPSVESTCNTMRPSSSSSCWPATTLAASGA